MTLADATVKSMKKWTRKPADLYPTPHAATVAVYRALGLTPEDTIYEPACGRGDISRILEHLGNHVVSTDLRHTGFGAGGVDYLDPAFLPRNVEVVFTNPPFSLAEEFIRKSVVDLKAPRVAMLLKSNFWNAKSRLKLWDECTPTGFWPCTWRLPFLKKERGNSPIMDCDWWSWDVSKPPLPCRPLERPHPADVPDIGGAPFLTHVADLGEAIEHLTAVIDGL